MLAVSKKVGNGGLSLVEAGLLLVTVSSERVFDSYDREKRGISPLLTNK